MEWCDSWDLESSAARVPGRLVLTPTLTSPEADNLLCGTNFSSPPRSPTESGGRNCGISGTGPCTQAGAVSRETLPSQQGPIGQLQPTEQIADSPHGAQAMSAQRAWPNLVSIGRPLKEGPAEQLPFGEMRNTELRNRRRGRPGRKPYSGVFGIYRQEGKWVVCYLDSQRKGLAVQKQRVFYFEDDREEQQTLQQAKLFLRWTITTGRKVHCRDGDGLSTSEMPAYDAERDGNLGVERRQLPGDGGTKEKFGGPRKTQRRDDSFSVLPAVGSAWESYFDPQYFYSYEPAPCISYLGFPQPLITEATASIMSRIKKQRTSAESLALGNACSEAQ